LFARWVSATFKVVPFTPVIPNQAPIKNKGIKTIKLTIGIEKFTDGKTTDKFERRSRTNLGCGENQSPAQKRKNPHPENKLRISPIRLPLSCPYFSSSLRCSTDKK
jgi:hypothetical protein